jgi:hypothetical protein
MLLYGSSSVKLFHVVVRHLNCPHHWTSEVSCELASQFMLDDHLPTALDEQGIAPEFRPDPALQVASGDPGAMAVVADGGVEVDPARRAISALLLRLHDSQLVLETQLAVVTPPMVSQPIRTVLEETPPIPPHRVRAEHRSRRAASEALRAPCKSCRTTSRRNCQPPCTMATSLLEAAYRGGQVRWQRTRSVWMSDNKRRKSLTQEIGSW